MLLIRYKQAPQLYLSARQQQELQRNADRAGKSVSRSAAATEAEQETGHRPLQKLLIRDFFPPFEQRGHNVHKLQKKKEHVVRGILPLERD